MWWRWAWLAAPRDFSASVAARHSQQVGAAARALARYQRTPDATVDHALVAGMLHDIGKMLLASNLPEDFERAVQMRHLPPLERERVVFGANHAEIGAYLLGRNADGQLKLTEFLRDDLPPYAISSHTWRLGEITSYTYRREELWIRLVTRYLNSA